MGTHRLDLLKEMLLTNTSDTFIHYAIAQEYMLLHQWPEALKTFRELLEIDPAYTGAYYHYARCAHAHGDVPESLQIIQTGIQVAQKKGDFHAASELRSLQQTMMGETE